MSSEDTPGRRQGFFFIGGAHKSGTTWMMRMLNAHPQVGVVGEAAFVGFKHGVDAWFNRDAFHEWGAEPMRKHLWLGGIEQEDIDRAMKRAMVEAMMRLRHTGPQVEMFGDKTPHFYNAYPEELHDIFPDGLFIDMVRDGRDVAISHIFHMLRLKYEHGARPEAEAIRRYHVEGEGKPVPLFSEETLTSFIGKWRHSLQGSQRAQELFGDAYMMVRYEDLIANTAQELARILKHLGVRHGDYIVGHCIEQHTFKKASGRSRGEGDPSSFFRKGVAGDWVNYFEPKDKDLFKEKAGDLLIEHGYEKDHDW